MEYPAVIIEFRPFDETAGVDEDFGPEVDAFEDSYFGPDENLDNDHDSSDLVARINFEETVLVGEVEVGTDDFIFKPEKETRLSHLLLYTFF